MTLEQLRVFVAVAERQQVTRAAETLNIAQSAVSSSIAALEGRHGAKLFHRVGCGIELTEAGALFLVEAPGGFGRGGGGGAGRTPWRKTLPPGRLRHRVDRSRRAVSCRGSRRFGAS